MATTPDMTALRARAEQLRKELDYHARLYYVEDAPVISDYEYDKLYYELVHLEEDYPELDHPASPTHRVGGKALDKLPAAIRHVYALILIVIGWVLFRAASLHQVITMLTAMFGYAPGGVWSVETEYYLRQFAWEWVIAIPAVLPVKKKLQAKLSAKAERGCGVCRWTLFLGPKALALFLLVWSTVQLLSSTFRSFLYFQF